MAQPVNVTKGDVFPVGANQDDIFIHQSDGTMWTFDGRKFVPAVSNVGGTAGGALTGTYPNPTIAASATLTTPTIVGSGGTLTLPAGPDTLVGRATTDTLTNKTLTSPVISTISNTGTITLPTSTDTLVGKATTDTLTNKTLSAPVITGGATVTGNVAAAAANNLVLLAPAGQSLVLASNNATQFAVGSSGGLFANGVTGTDKGAGTGNFTALYIGGVAVGTSSGYKQLGKGTATANQNITSTASPGTDITGLTVTCTPDGTHDVKITVSLPDLGTTSGHAVFVALQKDGVIVDTLAAVPATGAGVMFSAHATFIDAAPTNASHTYKVSLWQSAADTTKTINGDGTSPTNLILVEQTS